MTVTAEVKERPILFSGHMVRAILEGRKTQTRRVIKPQPTDKWMNGGNWQEYYKSGKHQVLEKTLWIENHENGKEIPCPYGKPGDRLWVRETFATRHPYELEGQDSLTYRADYLDLGENILSAGWGWKPSIFMPRWASRITLEITDVRVERVQDISEADAIAEGIFTNEAAIEKLGLPADTKLNGSAVDKYRIVWESINGKKYPWASNPWVWVVAFRRVEP